MKRRLTTTEIHILLRMILSAGVLAVLLVCAGTAAGVTTCTDYRCAQAAEVAA